MSDDPAAPRDLSEFELIDRFVERGPLPERVVIGTGDDAAVVAARGAVVTSVDTVVEGIHFRRDWTTPKQIGIKAVGAALSDLAAMGVGEAGIEVYLSLGAPRESDQEFLIDLASGARAAAGRYGATMAGGDTVASPTLFLSVTVVGHVADPGAVVPRSGARPGDAVAVTGELGSARAGLWLLEDPGLPVTPELPPEVRRRLIDRHLEVSPRIRAGGALARLGAQAMIDLSDGLVADLGHVARASSRGDADGVVIRVDAERVPAGAGVDAVAVAAGLHRLEPALAGGEDYELAVTMPPDRVAAATLELQRLGVPLTVIGEVLQASSERPVGVAVELDGQSVAINAGGFDHFG